MFKKPDPKQSFPKLEEEIQAYWDKNETFKKSLRSREGAPEYVFYDGPPFATGLPHYGHLLAGTLKDVIPRYQTMRGKRVERKWGWDCHGLPVENLIEKDLNLADKKALEKFGIDNFNEACRSSVLKYVDEWRTTVHRMGRWVDFEDSYKTMDPEFMESVWWVFKSLWNKGLIYQGKKSMHICPRCVTPLSNFEVGLGYKDVTDFSSTSKFKLTESPQKKKLFGDVPTYVLAWTTTTWTLPGNTGLAIGKDINYIVAPLNEGQHQVILATDCWEAYSAELESAKPRGAAIKGSKLVNLSYEPLFTAFTKSKDPNLKTSYRVIATDFVDTASGTGIVHIAPGYGEDDYAAGLKENLLVVSHVNMDGSFVKELGKEFSKHSLVGSNNKRKADEFVWCQLEKKGYEFSRKSYKHSYPHCWRCDNPLLNYGTDAWFVSVEKIKEKMLAANEQINWVPDHIKHGRFGKWLENARDWCISRNRYWGSPLPIWQSEDGKRTECIGSMAELRSKLGNRITKVTFIRHGESVGNTTELYQGQEPGTPLTPTGINQAKAAAKQALKIHKIEKFDVLLTSPLLRTQQTAEYIGQLLKKKPREDTDVREIDFGENEGKQAGDCQKERQARHALPPEEHYVLKQGTTGESHQDVQLRMENWLKKILKKQKGKSIAVVTHSDPIRCLLRGLKQDPLKKFYSNGHFPKGQPKELYFDTKTGQLLDLHKHHVDKMTYKSKGKTMRRIPEVLDCWFESGSMPYGQAHYPFENKEQFEATFPAEFIAEGLDQTRGWFYTLVVLAAALFDKPSFKNCIVNGMILAEDGQKMSKSKQNYPPVEHIFNEYGADAMRLYLMNSSVVKAEALKFSEAGVNEVLRSILLPLWNSYSFFITYAEIDGWKPKNQLYFVRHGQTDFNRDHKIQGSGVNESLNPKGVEQAQDVADRVKNLPIDIIVSSDLNRARETTSIIYEKRAQKKGKNKLTPLVIDQSFREQDLGEFEGELFSDLQQKKPKDVAGSHYIRSAHKEGQTLEEYEQQVLEGLKKIQAANPGANILIVSHAGVGHVLKKHHLGIESWKEYFQNTTWIKNTDLLTFEENSPPKTNKLDAWIISELNSLVQTTTEAFEGYDLQKATDPLVNFIDTLTNWYIRRSRRRFWKSENDEDKNQAYETLYTVLVELCKLLAPFAPFISESMYRNLTGQESVHLSDWPLAQNKLINQQLNTQINLVRKIVTLGHAARAKAQLKVRQPLSQIEIAMPHDVEPEQLSDQVQVIAEELNVKQVHFLKKVPKTIQTIVRPNARVLGPIHGQKVQDIIAAAKNGKFKVSDENIVTVSAKRKQYKLDPTKNEVELGYESTAKGRGISQEVQADSGIVVILDTNITADLRREGIARELVRTIQDLRKEADLNVSDHITVGIKTKSKDIQKAIKEHKNYLMAETLAEELSDKKVSSIETVVNIEGDAVVVSIERVV